VAGTERKRCPGFFFRDHAPLVNRRGIAYALPQPPNDTQGALAITESYTTDAPEPVAPTPPRRLAPLAVAGYAGIMLLLAVTFSVRFLAQDLPSIRQEPWAMAVAVVALVVSLAGWAAVAATLGRVTRRLGNEGLATIGLVAGLHFAATYTSVLFGRILSSLLGPMSIFITGVADEGISCLLIAVLVVLLPRPGTVMLLYLVQFLLNCLFGGSFGLMLVIYVTVSIVLVETTLALSGITTTKLLAEPRPRPTVGMVARVAVAIGFANAAPLAAQYCLSAVFYRFYYPLWYMVAVAVLPGFVYGGAGAALGTFVGYRLRRVAR
jgi:hypothetical protein